MIPIVKSRIEPENIHALWLDSVNTSLKIFGPNGWEPISGISNADLEALNKALSDIESLVGTDKSDDIDTLEEIKRFLTSFKDNQNLKQYISDELTKVINSIDSVINSKIGAIPEDELNKILI